MAVTFVVIALFTIPTLLQIRKTAIASREILARIENEMKPVLQTLQESLTDLKAITEEASGKIGGVGLFMEELGHASRSMHRVNSVVGTATGLMTKTSLWMTGAKVAWKVAVNQILKKRR